MLKKKIILVLLVVSLHLVLLGFCIKMSEFRGMVLDEARYIPAGVRHWRHGDFAPANDAPPLSRLIATLPLLPLEVHLPLYEPADRDDGPAARATANCSTARILPRGS